MKKIYILLVSIICFFALIFISVPYLVGNKKNTKVNEKNIDLINSINRLNESRQKLQYSLLNKDNLYENYSYNYAIKIPEGYKTNKGIGKYSSVQFYNEQLGYVVVVNVGESDFKDISLQDNNMIINKFEREYKTDLLLNDIIEKAMIDRGGYAYGFNNLNLKENLKKSLCYSFLKTNKRYEILNKSAPSVIIIPPYGQC